MLSFATSAVWSVWAIFRSSNGLPVDAVLKDDDVEPLYSVFSMSPTMLVVELFDENSIL